MGGGEGMTDKRQHRRFGMELLDINGSLNMANTTEILDMSFGGVAVKMERRLSVGKDCVFTLENNGTSIDMVTTVVRCTLKGFEERPDGKRASIYTTGMKFDEGSTERVADFVRSAILS
jgi:Tfp pilus assembly protein PilZ